MECVCEDGVEVWGERVGEGYFLVVCVGVFGREGVDALGKV